MTDGYRSLLRKGRLFILSFIVAFPTILIADREVAEPRQVAFQAWLKALKKEAEVAGISPATLEQAFHGVEPIPRVIELDRNQPELKLTLNQYLERVISKDRKAKGRRNYRANRDLLNRVSRKYGVQARYLVAFWGIETDYGRLTGGYPVVAALATLAYDGRRSRFFRKELLNALRIIDAGHVGASEMIGSWAGAMGQTQFMPSTFLSYAVDGDGDGRIDLWTNKEDIFSSAANFLAKLGWKDDQTWGREVELPAGFDAGLISRNIRKRISDWSGLGVRRLGGGSLPGRDLQAALVRPDGHEGRVYMVYHNYHAILNWNRSDLFAIAVGTLSDAVVR